MIIKGPKPVEFTGVILQLSGPKVGVELSAALGGVTISMR